MKFKLIEDDERSPETNAAVELMRQNLEYESSPEVGLFWYDPAGDELYGVESILASEANFYHSPQWSTYVKTCRKGHEQVWKKEHFRGKDSRFTGDYTKNPRGRVFDFKDHGFRVMVGHWIKKYPEAIDLVIEEFNLPPDDTEFKIDSHWDIDHGWSDEF